MRGFSWAQNIQSAVGGIQGRVSDSFKPAEKGTQKQKSSTQQTNDKQFLRLPLDSAKKLKWFDKGDIKTIIDQHLQEKLQLQETIKALQQVLINHDISIEDFGSEVKDRLKESDEVRESDYGVNSTLLIAAHAEIDRLNKTIVLQGKDVKDLKLRLGEDLPKETQVSLSPMTGALDRQQSVNSAASTDTNLTQFIQKNFENDNTQHINNYISFVAQDPCQAQDIDQSTDSVKISLIVEEEEQSLDLEAWHRQQIDDKQTDTTNQQQFQQLQYQQQQLELQEQAQTQQQSQEQTYQQQRQQKQLVQVTFATKQSQNMYFKKHLQNQQIQFQQQIQQIQANYQRQIEQLETQNIGNKRKQLESQKSIHIYIQEIEQYVKKFQQLIQHTNKLETNQRNLNQLIGQMDIQYVNLQYNKEQDILEQQHKFLELYYSKDALYEKQQHHTTVTHDIQVQQDSKQGVENHNKSVKSVDRILEHEIQQLKSQLQHSKNDIYYLESQVSQKERQLISQQEIIEQQKLYQYEGQQIEAQLKDSINDLENDLQQTVHSTQIQQQEIHARITQEYQENYQKLQKDIKGLKDINENLQGRAEKADQIALRLDKELKETKIEYKKLEQKIQQQNKQLLDMDHKLQQTQKQLGEMQKFKVQNDKLNSQIRDLNADKESLQSIISKKSEENQALLKSLQDANRKSSLLVQQYQDYQNLKDSKEELQGKQKIILNALEEAQVKISKLENFKQVAKEFEKSKIIAENELLNTVRLVTSLEQKIKSQDLKIFQASANEKKSSSKIKDLQSMHEEQIKQKVQEIFQNKQNWPREALNEIQRLEMKSEAVQKLNKILQDQLEAAIMSCNTLDIQKDQIQYELSEIQGQLDEIQKQNNEKVYILQNQMEDLQDEIKSFEISTKQIKQENKDIKQQLDLKKQENMSKILNRGVSEQMNLLAKINALSQEGTKSQHQDIDQNIKKDLDRQNPANPSTTQRYVSSTQRKSHSLISDDKVEGVDAVYLKNILFKFLEAIIYNQDTQRDTLLPVIATILYLKPKEFRYFKELISGSGLNKKPIISFT